MMSSSLTIVPCCFDDENCTIEQLRSCTVGFEHHQTSVQNLVRFPIKWLFSKSPAKRLPCAAWQGIRLQYRVCVPIDDDRA